MLFISVVEVNELDTGKGPDLADSWLGVFVAEGAAEGKGPGDLWI